MPEIVINLSPQAVHLLKELERWGLYGVTKEEIAGRFIDKCLIDMAERGLLKLKPKEAMPPVEMMKRL